MRISQKFLRIQAGEAGIVFSMGAVLLINALAQQVSEITAISNLLSGVGVNFILVIWMIDSVITLVTMGLQSIIIDRFNRISLVKWIIVAFSTAFLLMRLLYILGAPDWLNYALLYLLAMQQLVFFPVVFWILANDIFNVAQAKRLFPLINSFGFIGKLTGIIIALIVPSLSQRFAFLRPEGLILMIAGFYLIILGLFYLGTRSIKLRAITQVKESLVETLSEGWDFVRGVPVFRYLSLSIFALLICDVVIEFRFLVVSNEVFRDPASYQRFYSTYSLGITIAIILMQSILTSRIISRLTIKNSFLIKPISTLIGSSWMFLQNGLIGAVGGEVLLRFSQYALDLPTRNTFLSLVPEERRGRVSIFNESYLYFAGMLTGSLMTGAVVLIGIKLEISSIYRIYLGVSIIMASLATYAILKLRKNYDSSMLNWRLKRRQRGRSVLDQLEL